MYRVNTQGKEHMSIAFLKASIFVAVLGIVMLLAGLATYLVLTWWGDDET